MDFFGALTTVWRRLGLGCFWGLQGRVGGGSLHHSGWQHPSALHFHLLEDKLYLFFPLSLHAQPTTELLRQSPGRTQPFPNDEGCSATELKFPYVIAQIDILFLFGHWVWDGGNFYMTFKSWDLTVQSHGFEYLFHFLPRGLEQVSPLHTDSWIQPVSQQNLLRHLLYARH